MSKGKLIILNGGSSAGKTTVARSLQNYALKQNELFLHFGIDSFFDLFPDNIGMPESHKIRESLFAIEDLGLHGQSYPIFKHTPKGNKVVESRYLSIRSYLDKGFNIIGDEQFWELEWHKALLNIFNDNEVFLVKVFADKNVVRQRELQRDSARLDRLCFSSYDYSHRNMEYDYIIDTTKKTPEVLAKDLYQAYNQNTLMAFSRLRLKYSPI
ncbi:hypothetical protein OAO18_01965 [Francisellaceae bacterium]|nr:hypothetical protein [Francisellaceae bacterium]